MIEVVGRGKFSASIDIQSVAENLEDGLNHHAMAFIEDLPVIRTIRGNKSMDRLCFRQLAHIHLRYACDGKEVNWHHKIRDHLSNSSWSDLIPPMEPNKRGRT